MKLKIYQINHKKDNDKICFSGLKTIQRVRPEIYDNVFSGELQCTSLEDVYKKFNLDIPEDYIGRSMSVSDVVEVIESETIKTGFYYCEDVGFTEIKFDSKLAEDFPEKTIKVIVVAPGNKPIVKTIPHTLKSLQNAVDGYIEAIYPYEDPVAIICNDEGKFNGCIPNRKLFTNDRNYMTYEKMKSLFIRNTQDNKPEMKGYIVFSENSFNKKYEELERTYEITSKAKAYDMKCGGSSIYGNCLDGKDKNVRLDGYMAQEKGGKDGWKTEKCYIEEKGEKPIDIIYGTFLITGIGAEDFTDIPEGLIKKYLNLFDNCVR